MTAPSDPATLYDRLRRGEEAAFRELIRTHRTGLLQLARSFVKDSATAEEVLQETWLAVIEGLDGLEDPRALTGWIYRILANKARRRGQREARSAAFSELAETAGEAPAVDPAAFTRRGFWAGTVPAWDAVTPERVLGDRQSLARAQAALDGLPPLQRATVLLTTVAGLAPEAVCEILDISEANRRVLLHRGRAALRRALAEQPSGGDRSENRNIRRNTRRRRGT